jgi:subtilisin family serine protease
MMASRSLLLFDYTPDRVAKIKKYISDHALPCTVLSHTACVHSDDLAKLEEIKGMIGAGAVIIPSLRIRSIAPVARQEVSSTMSRQISNTPAMSVIGRYNVTDANTYGEDIIVATIDADVDSSHPEFADRYLGYYYGFDKNDSPVVIKESDAGTSDHATHCMGTLCGSSIGIAPKAKFTYFRLFYSDDTDIIRMFSFFNLLLKLHRKNPQQYKIPHVFNCSFGASLTGLPEDMQAMVVEQYATAMKHLMHQLDPFGSLLVFAAGNNRELGNPIQIPSFLQNVISVGSVKVLGNSSVQLSSFSSFGKTLNANDCAHQAGGAYRPVFLAPGENIVSSIPGGGYMELTGTSMAAPYAAGTIAVLYGLLLKQGCSRVKATRIIRGLLDKPCNFVGPKTISTGYGLLQLDKLVAEAKATK